MFNQISRSKKKKQKKSKKRIKKLIEMIMESIIVMIIITTMEIENISKSGQVEKKQQTIMVRKNK